MTPRRTVSPAHHVDLDPVSAGAGVGALSGLLALGLPYFAGLTAALAGLVAVAWATRPLRPGGGSSSRRLGAAAIAAGWVAFLLLPPPFAILRATALGASLLPLWYSGGRAVPFGGSEGA